MCEGHIPPPSPDRMRFSEASLPGEGLIGILDDKVLWGRSQSRINGRQHPRQLIVLREGGGLGGDMRDPATHIIVAQGIAQPYQTWRWCVARTSWETHFLVLGNTQDTHSGTLGYTCGP